MNGKDIPTPYMWSYQPQSGRAAGASQDYSSRMNWMSAGPSMINHVRDINQNRNDILMTQALMTETPRLVRNPPVWPSDQLFQQMPRQVIFEIPRDNVRELYLSNCGLQLAGGGVGEHLPYCINNGLCGSGIQLSSNGPTASQLRADGQFQLAGGSRSSFSPQEAYLTLQDRPSRPRSGGLGAVQFVAEFVPSIYPHPFSGPPGSYPDEFISNYDIVSDSVRGYD